MERNVENLRIAKDLKYTALYWALGFKEEEKGVFAKPYGKKNIRILANEGKALVEGITIINGDFLPLDGGDSFVILEFLDLLFSHDVELAGAILDLDNEFHFYIADQYISCQDYDASKARELPQGKFSSILYQSKLYSGFIERKCYLNGEPASFFFKDGKIAFEIKESREYEENGFHVKDETAISYSGNEEKVVVPLGAKRLASSLFWDNQTIKEVVLPEGLVSLGGDTFYNCSNLEKVIIPSSCEEMGDNPFAGCPKLVLVNRSPHFVYDENGLRNKKGKYIHFPILSKEKEVEIPDDVRIIGKHAFYLCEGLKKITIPSSVIHIQNFPFSGCINLTLENHSPKYRLQDGVLYSEDGEELIGVLPNTKTDCLSLPEGLKTIRRNSLFKCIGIKKIVFPSTLNKIGYNPFVGCDMEFVSLSDHFKVEGGVLYNSDYSKLIACPPSKAIGHFSMRESVIELERGAFSGCRNMESISLKNVSLVGKSCFTNCISLKNVYLSDFVQYVGEWAFAHCGNLEEVSAYKDTIIDKNAFANSNAKLTVRPYRSNYLVVSDNLFALKSLKRTLEGKVDSILIDPPYDSKIGYIGYKDDFGNGYPEFMKERLLLAKDLLSGRGWLVMNIDKGSFGKLLLLTRSIFGKRNVSWKLWKVRNRKFDQNRKLNTKKKKGNIFEFIIFAKKGKEARLNPILDGKGKMRRAPFIFDGYGTNSSAKDELAEELGERGLFQTSKPTKLIKELVRATSQKDSIVLDFFAGSGTTGKAVSSLNEEDGGDRRYILVTNSEGDIPEKVTKKRLKEGFIGI